MSEIRFSSPVEEIKGEDFEPFIPKSHNGKLSSVKKLFVFVGLVGLIVLVLAIYKLYLFPGAKYNPGTYYAAFLTNGQVYFGKMKTSNKVEMILTDVYYLQPATEGPSSGVELSGKTFSLIKLGNELHGPTEDLFINKDHIIFYEELRPDSRVIQSIEQQNNSN